MTCLRLLSPLETYGNFSFLVKEWLLCVGAKRKSRNGLRLEKNPQDLSPWAPGRSLDRSRGRAARGGRRRGAQPARACARRRRQSPRCLPAFPRQVGFAGSCCRGRVAALGTPRQTAIASQAGRRANARGSRRRLFLVRA